jgi:hypothetical protein
MACSSSVPRLVLVVSPQVPDWSPVCHELQPERCRGRACHLGPHYVTTGVHPPPGPAGYWYPVTGHIRVDGVPDQYTAQRALGRYPEREDVCCAGYVDHAEFGDGRHFGQEDPRLRVDVEVAKFGGDREAGKVDVRFGSDRNRPESRRGNDAGDPDADRWCDVTEFGGSLFARQRNAGVGADKQVAKRAGRADASDRNRQTGLYRDRAERDRRRDVGRQDTWLRQ